MWSKMLILSVVLSVCIAATVTIANPEEKPQPVIEEDLKTAESHARQFGYPGAWNFGHGGYGHHGGAGGFGGYGGYGGAWSHGGGYGGYGHVAYPQGGGYGHHHG